MSGINLPTIPGDISYEDFVNLVARVFKELQWFTEGNIDTANIRNLKAEKIKAGKMIGFVIQTNEDGAYPNIIFSSDDNLIQAFSDADNHVDMTANAGSSPGLLWTVDGDENAYLNSTSAGPIWASFNDKDITIQPAGDLNLSLNSFGNLTIGNETGETTTITYVKNIIPDDFGGFTAYNGTLTFTKGILTNFT